MNWKDIEKVNSEINSITLKRSYRDKKTGEWKEISSEYVEVKERVIAFRKLYPNGQIIPEISFSENYVVCDATILDNEGHILAKGHARELANKEFSLENCETSAIGRALGFCGLGISISIASAEEINKVDESKIFDEPFKKDLVEQFTKLYSNMDQARIMNGLHVTNAFDMSTEDLKKYINLRKYGKEHNSNE